MAIPIASDPHKIQGMFSTSDSALAAILGALGFEWRYTAPIMLVVDSDHLNAMIERRLGAIEDCYRWQAVFVDRVKHKRQGVIQAALVEVIHKNRKMQQRHQYNLPVDEDQWNRLKDQLVIWNPSGHLLDLVESIGDGIENHHLIADRVEELTGNPLIQASKSLKDGATLRILRPRLPVDEGNHMIEKYLKKIA